MAAGPLWVEPIDPETEQTPGGPRTLAAILAGGVLGALARYQVGRWWPPGAFPWSTLAINVIGCFLLALVVVAASELWVRSRLLRPFAGTGVLGGFTTLSTLCGQAHGLLDRGREGTALAYLGATALLGILATVAGLLVARRLATRLGHR